MPREDLESLPLFPLPLVLLPGQSMPLHVFEPRYQAMVAAVMEGDNLLGLATLVKQEDAMLEQAEIHPVFAVGRILTHQPLDGRRSNVLLRYEGRVRMVSENPLNEGGFRTTHVEWLAELDGVVPQAQWIRALLTQMMPSSAAAQASFQKLAAREDVDMLTVLADLALTEATDRLRYLSAESLAERGELVQRRLAERVAMTRQPVGDA